MNEHGQSQLQSPHAIATQARDRDILQAERHSMAVATVRKAQTGHGQQLEIHSSCSHASRLLPENSFCFARFRHNRTGQLSLTREILCTIYEDCRCNPPSVASIRDDPLLCQGQNDHILQIRLRRSGYIAPVIIFSLYEYQLACHGKLASPLNTFSSDVFRARICPQSMSF
jgi:hypothetical protein